MLFKIKILIVDGERTLVCPPCKEASEKKDDYHDAFEKEIADRVDADRKE